MSAPTLDVVRRAGEALMPEVGRALWQAHAGLASAAPALSTLYARHRAAYGDDALAAAREAAEADDAARTGARALLEWVVEQRVAAALAPLDERELAWERSAAVRPGDGRTVGYGDLSGVLAGLTGPADRAERLLWDAARARLVGAELAPLRRERLAREHDLVAALALGDGYVGTFAALTGTDVRALADACDRLLADTAPMWDDVLATFARRRLGLARGELARGDVPALLRAREWDSAFTPGAMVASVATQLAAMGVDATAGGRVTRDVGERAGKRARAFCAPVRIPGEVHLVVRPRGGAGDWRAFLHEQGHALHLAHTHAGLPLEARWGGDSAVGEGYAALLEQLLLDRGWLVRYGGLDRERAAGFARSAAFEQLYLLRRHAAKLRYELALHDGATAWSALGELYVETLGRATGVRHAGEDALVDVDPRLYVVRYLRGWQLQAVLAATLRERFDEDWWRNPRAGPWLVAECWGEGQREDADAVARRVAGVPLDFARVTRALEATLA